MHKSRLALTCSVFALASSLLPLQAQATENGITPYASLKMAVESVQPDNETAYKNYESARDAYSKFGLNGHYNINDATAVFAQVEVPFDSVNLSTHDPYDQDEPLNTAYVGLSGNWGTVTLGQQWMPYYNVIAAPVDMFSSYYSGFGTYTVFRVRETISYVSPTWNGFTFSGGYTSPDGNERSTMRLHGRRIQATASYATGDTTVAIGVDDAGSDPYGGYAYNHTRVYGASLAQTFGDFYLGAKYEYVRSDNRFGTGVPIYENGNQAISLFTSYTFGKNTAKLLLANVDNYGESIVHMGLDHQFTKKLKFFAEFYYEEDTAAMTQRKDGMAGIDWGGQGGKVFMAGFHYDIL
jgi:predicted porin